MPGPLLPFLLQALLILPELISNGSMAVFRISTMIRNARSEGRDLTPAEFNEVVEAARRDVADFESAWVAAGGTPWPGTVNNGEV